MLRKLHFFTCNGDLQNLLSYWYANSEDAWIRNFACM